MTESPESIAVSQAKNSATSASSPASSSSSEEIENVPLSARLTDLSACEKDIASLLSAAASAIDALNPAVSVEPEQSRRDKYAVHAKQFFAELEKVSVHMKRSVRGLEEAEVPINPINARWVPNEDSSYNKLVREFMLTRANTATIEA